MSSFPGIFLDQELVLDGEPSLNDFSYEFTAPTNILFDRSIDGDSRSLYFIIKSLTRAHGYCFATNAYLGKAMGVSISSIQRYLRKLKAASYIKIVTNKKGIHWQRHVYLGVDLNKCLRRVKSDTPPCQIYNPPMSKMTHIISNTNNYIENEERGDEPKDSPKSSFSATPKKKKVDEPKIEIAPAVFLTQKQQEQLLKKVGDESKLKAAYAKLSDWKIGNQVDDGKSDYLRIINWVVKAVEKDLSTPKPQLRASPVPEAPEPKKVSRKVLDATQLLDSLIFKNIDYMKKNKIWLLKPDDCAIGETGIGICKKIFEIKLDDPDFKEKLLKNCIDHGFSV